jgi:sec-independent protein translocase protein TatA
MRIGVGEIITLVFIVVVIFSASRMGSLGNALGKFVYSFKKASKGDAYVEGKVTSRKLHRDDPVPEDAEVIDPKNPR